MKPFAVSPVSCLQGEISLPGDKSIAHRAVILSALAQGKTRIENFPTNKDCLSTVNAFKRLGVKITLIRKKDAISTVKVSGAGLRGLKKPKGPVFIGESGTTFRLLLGVLAGQDFEARLLAGKSLSKRPMLRVIDPLRRMGAEVYGIRTTVYGRRDEYPPITIKGGKLKPITYKVPVASAQVKSAILLAGLYASGATQVFEPIKTRDHTERMLGLFKARLKVKGNIIVMKGGKELVPLKKIYVPGDISSAAFFIVLGTIAKNSRILIRNVSLNPTRAGILKVLERMGALIKIKNQKSKIKNGFPMGDILVKTSSLKGAFVSRREIPSLIDELPILMVAASLAQGRTVFEGVGELRVKETDRIKSMTQNLKKMGAKIEVIKVGNSENIVIHGVRQLKGAKVKSFGDHRTAMSMVVAGLVASRATLIDDISCINKSFPDFTTILSSLMH